MTFYIFAVLILFIIQTFASSLTHFGPLGVDSMGTAMGGRDNLSPRNAISGRLDRAKQNMLEALPVFIPLALLIEMSGTVTDLATNGALVFLIARIIYVPAYASGIPGLRTAIWGVGHAGLLMMALSLNA